MNFLIRLLVANGFVNNTVNDIIRSAGYGLGGVMVHQGFFTTNGSDYTGFVGSTIFLMSLAWHIFENKVQNSK